MAVLSPEDIAYLHDQGKAKGYTPEDTNGLLDAIRYESSGRPDVWGGKGNKYFGLIQFGGPERAQFGVDTVHPNAKNQIDAAYKYLSARGYKPGMGLLDLYSTINAGSPGHYNASDRPGMTVAKHVAAMQGQSTPEQPIAGSAPVMSAGLAVPSVSPPPAVPEDDTSALLAAEQSNPQYDKEALKGLLTSLLAQPQEEQAASLPSAPDAPEAPNARTRSRGLAFNQLKISTPKFRIRTA